MNAKHISFGSGIREKGVLMLLLTSIFLLLFGGIFFVSKTSVPTITVSENATALVEQTEFDWGNIPYSGGKVSQAFSIKNTGTDLLKLQNIKTSCHCTTASITISGQQSPAFGMSGTSSWVGDVRPGKLATLTVIFDPAFHGPSGVGSVIRYVSVDTNDAKSSKITFTLNGNVIQK